MPHKTLKKIKPRKYQQNIYESCKNKNCLVVLPTGTGKTLISLMLSINRQKAHPATKTLFLAPTKPLAEQHLEYFKKHLPELFAQLTLFTGKIKPEKRKRLWQTSDIIFSTPQCISNDLKNNLYSLENTSLLIEDECVTGNSRIKINLDKEISIKELYEKFNENTKLYIDSLNKAGNIEPRKILKVHKIPNKKQILEIRTKDNKIKTTEDHLLIVKRENKFDWVEAKNLKQGDEIAIKPKEINETYENRILVNENNIAEKYEKSIHQTSASLKTIKRLKEKNLLPLNYQNPRLKIIAGLIGYILGDGWFTKVKEIPKIAGFSGNIKDLQSIQRDLDLLNIKYPRIHSRKTNSIINPIDKNKNLINGTTNSFNVTDSCLVKLLNALETPIGNKTTNPFLLPKWLMKSPKFIKKQFLAALMACEGDIPKIRKRTRTPYVIRYRFNKLKQLKQNALQYATQIQKLFQEFSVQSTIQIKKGNIRKNKDKTIQIHITLSNSKINFKNFLNNIGYKYNYKKIKEANKILNYIIYKENAFEKRKIFYERINILKKKGFNTHKAIQTVAKEFKINLSKIWSLGYSNKPIHSSWLIENYEQWETKNNALPKVNWEKITNIKKINNEKYVYDLTIEENHNYIANNFIVHNCHRCLKNYAYTYVAEIYKQQSENSRILGLTASPGVKKEKIKKIAENLGIEAIELRTRESEDVKEYLQERKFDIIKLEYPKEFKEISELIKKLYERKIKELKNRKLIFKPANKITLLETQGKIMKSIQKGNKNFNNFAGATACAQAIKLSHLIELLETQTLHTALNYINGLFEQASQKKSKASIQITKRPEFNSAYIKLNELISKNIEHPKLLQLQDLIKQSISKNPNNKTIVFSQYRDTVSKICENLNKISNINAEVFVGQAKKSGFGKSNKGLSQKEQKKIMDEFRENKINIIGATSLHPEEYIILKKDNKIQIKKIGEFIESFINNKNKISCSKKISNWETLTTDGKKTFFKPITQIHRHLAKDNLIKIKLDTGFDSYITKDHSLFTFSNKNKFTKTKPEINKFIALSLKIKNQEINKKIDILKELYDNSTNQELINIFGTIEGLNQAKIRTLKTEYQILSKLKNNPLNNTELTKKTKKDYSTILNNLKNLSKLEYITQKRINQNYKKISKITSNGKNYLEFLNWFIKNTAYKKGKYRFDLSNKNKKSFNKFFEQNVNVHYGKISFPRILEINKYLARFLGFYVSEGYTRKTKSTSNVFLAARIKKMQDLMEESIKKGLKLKTRKNWRGIAIDSQISYYLIKNIFKAGIGSYNKEVPEIIFTAPNKIKLEFLKAYIQGDGHIAKDRIVLTTVSRKLITGLVLLLRMLGIQKITLHKQKNIFRLNILESLPFAKIKEKNNKKRNKYYTHLPQSLYSEKVFQKYKNYYKYEKNSYLKCRKYGIWKNEIGFDYIKEIEKIKKTKFVYDLSVKDTQNFIGGTGLVCFHNSIAEEGLDIPEVNSVIFYEPIPSAIRSIQRKGRTARLMKGKIIVLLTKDTLDEIFYYASMAKEKKMHRSINSIKKDLDNGTLNKNNPKTKQDKQNSLF